MRTQVTEAVSTERRDERLSVNVSELTAERIRRLARRHGISVTEVVARAIETEDFFDRHVAEGYRVLLRKRGRQIRVVFGIAGR